VRTPGLTGERAVLTEHGPIEEDLPIEDIRKEPLGLPEGFVWCDIDTTSAAEVRAHHVHGVLILSALALFAATAHGSLRAAFWKLCRR
jgi:hypothetical protein